MFPDAIKRARELLYAEREEDLLSQCLRFSMGALFIGSENKPVLLSGVPLRTTMDFVWPMLSFQATIFQVQ